VVQKHATQGWYRRQEAVTVMVKARQARIAEAVDDYDWQKFRTSLKGLSTTRKLDKLQNYWEVEAERLAIWTVEADTNDEEDVADEAARREDDIAIRVDNYLAALARGGLIFTVQRSGYSIGVYGRARYLYELLHGSISVKKD
jgi:hypothetical protein